MSLRWHNLSKLHFDLFLFTICYFLLVSPQSFTFDRFLFLSTWTKIFKLILETFSCYFFSFRFELFASSSTLEVFLAKYVLKISTNFTGEHSCRSVISSVKSHLGRSVLLYICCIFSEHLFLRIPLEGCFWFAVKKFVKALNLSSLFSSIIRLHI